MCRYATTRYKPHYACFKCRKAFKRRNKDEVDPEGGDHPARCPDCRLLMADMGLDFAPPRRADVRAWEALARMFEVGETFQSCGCGGPGWRPRRPADLAAFFEERLREYRAQRDRWQQSAASPARAAALRSWRERVARLEAAVALSA